MFRSKAWRGRRGASFRSDPSCGKACKSLPPFTREHISNEWRSSTPARSWRSSRTQPSMMRAARRRARPSETAEAARAWARHCAITGQDAQTAFAAISRALRRGPRSPSGWKNISVGKDRQAPSYCHSQLLATGFGRRVISVMGQKIQSRRKLFKYPHFKMTPWRAWASIGL